MTDTKTEWISVKEFKKRNPEAISQNTIYEQAAMGNLKSIRIGGKILVASDALDMLYEERSEQLMIRTTNDGIGHILDEQQAGGDRE